jgi:hypothetical protein
MELEFHQHKRLLGVFVNVARFLGWLLLVHFFLGLGGIIYYLSQTGDERASLIITSGIRESLMQALLPGLLALGLAQFLRYLTEEDYHPGWILRHADWICYLLAAMCLIEIVALLSRILIMPQSTEALMLCLTGMISPNLASLLAKALLLIGVGVALRRLTPIVDESRTLV